MGPPGKGTELMRGALGATWVLPLAGRCGDEVPAERLKELSDHAGEKVCGARTLCSGVEGALG